MSLFKANVIAFDFCTAELRTHQQYFRDGNRSSITIFYVLTILDVNFNDSLGAIFSNVK